MSDVEMRLWWSAYLAAITCGAVSGGSASVIVERAREIADRAVQDYRDKSTV